MMLGKVACDSCPLIPITLVQFCFSTTAGRGKREGITFEATGHRGADDGEECGRKKVAGRARFGCVGQETNDNMKVLLQDIWRCMF